MENGRIRSLLCFALAGVLALLGGCARQDGPSAVRAPANVRAEPVANAIRVSWEYGGEAIGFHVYRAVGLQDGKFSRLTSSALAGDVRTYDDHQAAPGVTYRYAVAAVGAEGESVLVENPTPVLRTGDDTTPEASHRLTIYWASSSTGRGTISSTPPGIDCDITTGLGCSATFAAGSTVTLTPHPSAGSSFEGWSPPCTAQPVCTLTLADDITLTATLRSAQATLALAVEGQGAVVSSVGAACRDRCAEAYPLGTIVTLRAVPDEGSAFVGWSGDCEGTGACSIELNANAAVTARFGKPKPVIERFTADAERVRAGADVTLRWEVRGAERLLLSSDTGLRPTEVSGRTSYTVEQRADTTYTLQAVNAYGSVSTTTTVQIGKAPVITSFTAAPEVVEPGASATLSWRVAGDGPISLHLDPGNLTVSGSSLEVRPERTTTYTLRATSPYGETEAKVEVRVRRRFTLTLSKTGGGRKGTPPITSAPAGIDCGERCQATFVEGDVVTLKPTDPKKLERWLVCRGYLFLDCATSRDDTLTVRMEGDLRVVAAFKK